MARHTTLAISRGLAVALLALAISGVSSSQYQCPRNDPQLAKCVENAVNELRPKLRSGVPEYDVPSLENLAIGTVPLVNITNFKATARHVVLSGLSNFKIDKLRVDMKKKRIDFDVTVPKAHLQSDIDVNAKILVQVNETGPVIGYADNVKAHVEMKFETLQRGGRDLIYFPTITAKVVITDYRATFRPQETKPKPVTVAINSVIADSRSEIVASMIPSLEKAIANKLLEIANKVVKHFTFDDLFPK